METSQPPRLVYNSKLANEYIAASGVASRYPSVTDQCDTISIDCSKLPRFSYNPSICKHIGRLWLSYRYHFSGDYRTRLGIAEIVDGVCREPRDLSLSGTSLEDARLISFRGDLLASWVESDFLGQLNPKSVIKYSNITSSGAPERVYQPAPHANDGQTMQKNWCFFESDENLFCIFLSVPEQIAFHLQGNVVINEHKTPAVRWPYGSVRGGAVVPYDGKLLRFFHSKTIAGIDRPEIRYYVGACIMEPKPPFAVTRVSRRPIIYGSELPKTDVFHFKQNVVFPCGAVANDGYWTLAIGVNDCACALAKITPEQLNL